MDVAALNGPSPQSPSPTSPVTHVSFDAGAEFNLSFFDSTDDIQGLSDGASVGSASPPPTKLPVVVPTTSSPPSTVLPSVKQEQQFAAADSNSSGHAKAFVPCKVCGDKASGYHYGVTSCEGCKGFFRRSIQKQIEYRCLRDGKCLVIRLNRNRCQFCRFRKCLAVGMSRDSVRYGRVPKRSRERPADESITVNNNNNCSPTAVTSPPTTPVLPSPTQQPFAAADSAGAGNVPLSIEGEPDAGALMEITASVTAAHTAHCNYSYTDEATRNSCPRSASPDSIDSLTLLPEQDGRKRVSLWQSFASLLTPCVQRVVEFAKRVPGFCELGQDDQLILIKLGFLEVWMVQTSCLASESGLTLWDGTLFSRSDFHLMYGAEFANALLSACSALAAFPLGDAERALAAAAVLLWPERPGLSDAKAVRTHHNRVVAALRLQLGRQAQQHLAPLLARLGDIRAVGSRHAQRLDWLRERWPLVRLPPLFAEIFDIPKAEGEKEMAGDMEGEVDDMEERDPVDDIKVEVDLDADEVDAGRREDEDVDTFEARRH